MKENHRFLGKHQVKGNNLGWSRAVLVGEKGNWKHLSISKN